MADLILEGLPLQRFRSRSSQKELMDGDNISFPEFHHCLQSLERINKLTFAYRPTLNWIKPLLRRGPLHIVDVGAGGGDMLRRIDALASQCGGKCHHDLVGLDLNPWSKKSADLLLGASTRSAVRFETGNVFHYEPARNIDVVISSLFTHHLDDDELVAFLRWMDRHARRGWFINDLHRHPIPYYFIKVATRLFSTNRMIRHDAAISVARAFKRRDWQQLLQRAGVADRARVRWYFPFRLCVACEKTRTADD